MSRNEPSAHQRTKHSAGISDNPKGIAPSSPGLRACELPWVHVQIVSQPQRGCGYVRAPMDTTPLGLAHPRRRPQGCSFLATLGFVAESLRDSRNYTLEMWVMISPKGEGRGEGEQGVYSQLTYRYY